MKPATYESHRMNTKDWLLPLAISFLFLGIHGHSTLSASDGARPNIIFILADDLGWMDTSVYGSTYYETPNVDRLAERGVRFTDAYAANPLCSPTRASILTGQDPARLRMTTPSGHLPAKPEKPLMNDSAPPNRKMITPRGKRFLPLDIRTLGDVFQEAGYTTGFMGKWHLGREPFTPENQGFEVVVGGRHHSGPPGGYFAPWPIDTIPTSSDGRHIDDVITESAVQFLESHDGPLLLNLWYYSVHAPFQAKEKLIDKYRNRTDPRGKQKSPTMAAMIETMDRNIGRIMRAVDQLDTNRKTIIVLFSDNGGNMYSRVDGTTPTNNAPLRAGKGNIHEGGVRVPCIISWPGVTEPGRVSSTPIISTDFYPTLLDIAGIEQNQNRDLDGRSLVPVLKGRSLDRTTLFWHFPHYVPRPGNLPASAVRRENWKLYRVYGEGSEREPAHQLYNLSNDPGERNNLAAKKPSKVQDLNRLIDTYLKDVEAIQPKKNPNYAQRVQGWRGSRHVQLTTKNKHLHIKSTGRDPWISTKQVSETMPSAVTVRMRSDSAGEGRVYYSTPVSNGFKGNFVQFTPEHNGEWHRYRIELPGVEILQALRIDPSTAEGTIEIDWIELRGKEGKIRKKWEF